MIPRRGSVLLAVSLLVVIAALVAAGILWSVEADAAAQRWRRRDDELRALSLAGARIAMATLQAQRDAILGGADFEPPALATVYEDEESGRRAVVHFDPFTGDPDAPERRSLPMAALCPLNQADSAALVSLGFGEQDARIVIERRPPGGYALPEDMPPPRSRVEAVSEAADATPSSLVTTTSWDADCPAATSLPPRRGRSPRRLVLGGGLEDQDRAWLAEALGAEVANAVAPLAKEQDWKGRTLADAAKALLGTGLSPQNLGQALDLLAADEAPFPKGRIDLGRAPARVLMTLPGIDEALAQRLIAGRASLDAKARSNIAWPLAQQVLDPAGFAAIVDRIAGRSLQWRVRIRAEFEPIGGSRAAPDPAGGPVQDRRPSVTLDVVLDCAGDAVRVVSMHESTWVDAARTATAATQDVDPPATDPGNPPRTLTEIAASPDAESRGPVIIKDEEREAEQEQSAASRPAQERDPGGRSGRWRPR
ncbi:MAG: hypothetical protein WCK33_08400 [Phycisphaerae bacterium]